MTTAKTSLLLIPISPDLDPRDLAAITRAIKTSLPDHIHGVIVRGMSGPPAHLPMHPIAEATPQPAEIEGQLDLLLHTESSLA